MEEVEWCAKCGHQPKQGGMNMYPDFCKQCAGDFMRMLDKSGCLNKLKRKAKKKRK
jgi:hypothetical protein